MRASVYQYMRHQGIGRIKIAQSTALMLRIGSNSWERLPLDGNPLYGFLLLTDLLLAQMGHEEFVIYCEPIANIKAPFCGMLAICSRDLGPAVCGIRVNSYDTEEDMVEDVLMISRSVARKASIAGLNLGGGHFVIDWDRPQDFGSNLASIFPVLEHIGSIIDEYDGKIIGAPDMHTHLDTMHIVQRKTQHVICNTSFRHFVRVENGLEEPGSMHGSGDPSSFAAYSAYRSMLSALKFLDGRDSLSGVRVLIIGLGRTGLALVDYLTKAGAEIYGADVDESTCQIMEELYPVRILARNAEQVAGIHKFPCDILAPCAMGQMLSDKRIKDFQCKIICGTANHQLNTDKDAILLQDRGILYIPDILANCGGLINASAEVRCDEHGNPFYREQYDEKAVKNRIDTLIDSTLEDILKVAREQNLSPHEVAIARADMRLSGQRKERWIRAYEASRKR